MARLKPAAPSGVLVLDKPRGPTSHDVVRLARRALATREVGHAGTLDPMATGVLVVAVGEATKLVPYLTAAKKTYEARVLLGRETGTLDAEGDVTREADVSEEVRDAIRSWPDEGEALANALASERARESQEPPQFSAIHVDGERAHAKARRGEDVALAERAVAVHALEIVGAGFETDGSPWLDLRVTADKGYYVRSLGRDFARRLGTVGHLTALRRLASGTFTVGEARALPLRGEELRTHLIPLVIAAERTLPVVRLSALEAADARFGRAITVAQVDAGATGRPSAWVDESGGLVAVGYFEDGVGRVLRGFSAVGQ